MVPPDRTCHQRSVEGCKQKERSVLGSMGYCVSGSLLSTPCKVAMGPQVFLMSACGGQAAGVSWLKYEVFMEDLCIKALVPSCGTPGSDGVFRRRGLTRRSNWASVP